MTAALLLSLLAAPDAWAGPWVALVDDGFGHPHPRLEAFAVYDGRLYAATGGPGGLRIWSTVDGQEWLPAASPGFGDAANRVATSLLEHDGLLHAGVAGDEEASVWRRRADATWERIGGAGLSTQEAVTELWVHGGLLHAGTRGRDGAEVFRFESGTWRPLGLAPVADPNRAVTCLVSFQGKLLAGVGDSVAALFVWKEEEETWNPVAPGLFSGRGALAVSSAASWSGRLFVATTTNDLTDTGGEVWSSPDLLAWTEAARPGFGQESTWAVEAWLPRSEELLAGTLDLREGGSVWSTSNGWSWERASAPGFGSRETFRVGAFAEHAGAVYAGGDDPRVWAQVRRTEDPEAPCATFSPRTVTASGEVSLAEAARTCEPAPGSLDGALVASGGELVLSGFEGEEVRPPSESVLCVRWRHDRAPIDDETLIDASTDGAVFDREVVASTTEPVFPLTTSCLALGPLTLGELGSVAARGRLIGVDAPDDHHLVVECARIDLYGECGEEGTPPELEVLRGTRPDRLLSYARAVGTSWIDEAPTSEQLYYRVPEEERIFVSRIREGLLLRW